MAHAKILLDYMHTLWQNRALTDTVICCDGNRVAAHSVILSAYSKTFAAVLNSPGRTYSSKKMLDITNAGLDFECLRVVVEYFYTGNLPIKHPNSLAKLIKIATSLHIPSLAELLSVTCESQNEDSDRDKVIVTSLNSPAIEQLPPGESIAPDVIGALNFEVKQEPPEESSRSMEQTVLGTLTALRSGNARNSVDRPSVLFTEVKETTTIKDLERSPASIPRKRGRPRINSNSEVRTPVAKRGRGRPRKETNSDLRKPGIQRGRGRPRKYLSETRKRFPEMDFSKRLVITLKDIAITTESDSVKKAMCGGDMTLTETDITNGSFPPLASAIDRILDNLDSDTDNYVDDNDVDDDYADDDHLNDSDDDMSDDFTPGGHAEGGKKFNSNADTHRKKKSSDDDADDPEWRINSKYVDAKSDQESNDERELKSPRMKKKAYKCATCDATIRGKTAMLTHQKDEHGYERRKARGKRQEKSFTCPHCEEEFVGRKSFIEHRRAAHPDIQIKTGKPKKPKEILKCEICDFEARGQRAKNVHQEEVHGISVPASGNKIKPEKIYKCKICDALCKTSTAWVSHYRDAHNEEKKLYQAYTSKVETPHPCPMCAKLFPSRGRLTNHLNRSHFKERGSDQDRTHLCYKCGKGFFTQACLNRHIQLHDDKQKEHICPHCGLKVSSTFGLTLHVKRVHVEVRAYVCNVCGKTLSDKANMKHHMSVAHGTGDTQKYPCSKCDKVFNRKGDLTKHLEAVHSGKVFKCDVCDATFVYKTTWVSHCKYSHPAPGTTFTCECGSTFGKYTGLYSHKRKRCPLKKRPGEERREAAHIVIDAAPSEFNGISEMIVKAPGLRPGDDTAAGDTLTN